ncbi:hypothetical protein BKA70DRAFT_1439233 [Coprinopsis sp. MPI-PUGE-AT-0042]|nr:hypothetical protein BKA70DRAFT_1439233 [Coprinopsis sp. MPI-PUGE-AT-0042]
MAHYDDDKHSIDCRQTMMRASALLGRTRIFTVRASIKVTTLYAATKLPKKPILKVLKDLNMKWMYGRTLAVSLTSLAKLHFDPKSSRSTTTKRDSLAAELETDPQLSAAKHLQQIQALNSSLSHAGLERQLLEAQRTTSDFKTKQRDKGPLIERLERDRSYFADCEKEEREEKERDQAKVCLPSPSHINDTPPSAPILVTQTLTDLHLTRAHLLEEHGATSVSVHQCTAEPASLESQNAQSFKLVQPLKAEVREAKEDATRIDLRLMLVERDVGYLQAPLESLKAEELYGDNAISTVDQVKVGRMEELEALLAEYENMNGQLANDLEALEGPTVSTDEFENVKKENKARQTISEHGQEIASQATKIDKLEQALFYLSSKIAGG